MQRTALRSLLRRLAFASFPVAAVATGAGCPYTTGCDPVPVNAWVDIPEGGLPYDGGIAPTSVTLGEGDCATLCGWDAGAPLKPSFNPSLSHECRVTEKPDAGLALLCLSFDSPLCNPVGGRLSDGQVLGGGDDAGGDPVGGWLARQAAFEAASVQSFDRLARELAAHGAPRVLVEGARRAGRDEVRHARAMTKLAARFGVSARLPAGLGEALPVRDLATVAVENAAEGCVSETFAALSAWRQAERAGDAAIRRAMGRIAEDETRHAELALAVDGWARTRLGEEDARQVQAKKKAAAEQLLARLVEAAAVPAPPRLLAVAGVPAPAESVDLLRALGAALWAA